MKKHRHLKIALPLMLSLAGTMQLTAQQRTVTGTVTSELNEPLPGAAVSEQGTYNGVTTDADGKFVISLQSGDNAVLVISYLGFTARNVEVRAGARIDVTLREDARLLDEVIVVGYGVQKKTNVSGSITSVGSRDLHAMATNRLEEALQGKSPIYIVRNSGNPGESSSMFLRGVGTFRGTSPIWVVDGIKGAPLANLDEVETVQILKDAASTAIYGVQGANGVIVVTTKKSRGRIHVEYNGFTRFNSTPNLPEMLGTQDYIDMYRARWRSNNPGRTDEDMRNSIKPFYFSTPSEVAALPDTQWADEVFRTGREWVHSLSVSGGSDTHTYKLAGAYETDDGTIRNTSYRKANLKAQFGQKITGWLTLNEIFSFSTDKRRPSGVQIWNEVYRGVPFMNVYDDANPMGTGYGYFTQEFAGAVDWQGGNPMESLMMKDYWNRKTGGSGILQAIVTPFDGLVWTTEVSGDVSASAKSEFRYNTYGGVPVNNINYVTGVNLQGTQFNYSQEIRRSYSVASYANYNRVIGRHGLGFMLGTEFGENDKVSAEGSATKGIPAQDLRSTGTTSSRDGMNDWDEGSSFAWFGRATYAYDDRYLLTANFRNDYTGNFAPGRRSAVFPSLSVGWNIAGEEFFPLDAVNQLKLRFGIGESGSADIDANLWRQEYRLQTNGTWKATKVVNEGITWETTRTANLGLDVGLLENTLTASFDVYDKKTRDVLIRTTLPPSTGFSTYDVNKGKISNRGFEAALEYRKLFGDVFFSVGGNVNCNVNKVLELGESDYLAGGDVNRTYVGSPVSSFYGYVADGLFRTQEEIDRLDAIAVASGFAGYNGLLSPGDVKFRDLNGDGGINEEDQTGIGSPWPKWTYGFNLYFDYKGFSLSMNWQGTGHVEVYNKLKPYLENMFSDWNSTAKVFDAWSPANTNSTIPRLGNSSHNYQVSSYMVEDGSYLKLKNIQMGYHLGKNVLSMLKLQQLKVYAGLQNALTFTGFSGLDPEFMTGSSYDRGVYRLDTYPQFRTFTAGLQAGF
jgi:TonB-linked SusC/RagA family outer membrane protein